VYDFYPKRIGHKFKGEQLEVKLDKISHSIFKVFYFTGISIFGYNFALKTIPSHSPGILGDGNVDKMMIDFPSMGVNWGIRLYYIISFTYHIENTIALLQSKPQNDFYEMVCHHAATLILITFSYVGSITHLGIHVLFLMDNGDIFIGVIRAVMDWCSHFITAIAYTLIMVSFTYFRLFLYCKDVLRISFFASKGFHDNSGFIHKMISALLGVLLILNIYWFILLVRMAMRFCRVRQMHDL
jgi:very-long-chain ceramide synthase